jgi:serine/threonine protein kinase
MTTIFCSNSHENPGTNLFCQVCGEKLSKPAISYLVSGAILEGRYRLVQQIGQGGFGRTYLCEDLNRFNEPCVLKEFAPQVHGATALEKAKNLFEREANVLYQLQHPQIPKFRELFQMTTGGGGLFLVQDYVAGHTYRYALNSRLQQNQTFREDEVRRLLVHLLPVLEYTHSLGVIHRDIAPDNLIIRSSDGLPVLIDFGGVKQIAVNAEIQAFGNTESLTRLGKAGYAPNEQMQKGTVSPHSDLYALAATCLVLLTGQEPTSLLEPKTMNWQWRKFIQLSPDLEQIFARMLQPKPGDRIQSATEVLQALQNPLNQQTPLPVGLPATKPTTPGTAVVSPNNKQVLASPHQKNAFVSSSDVTTNMSSNGWRKMINPVSIGIVGTLAAIGLGWGAISGVNKPKPMPTTATSPEPELLPSNSPSPDSSANPPVTTESETPSPETSPLETPKPRSIESGEGTPTVESTPRSRRSRARRSRVNSESSPSPSEKSEESGQSSKSEKSELENESEQPKPRRRRRRVVSEEPTPQRSTTRRKQSQESNAPNLEGNNRKTEPVEQEPRTKPVRPDKPDQPDKPEKPDQPAKPEPKDEPADNNNNDNEPTITQPKQNESPLF